MWFDAQAGNIILKGILKLTLDAHMCLNRPLVESNISHFKVFNPEFLAD